MKRYNHLEGKTLVFHSLNNYIMARRVNKHMVEGENLKLDLQNKGSEVCAPNLSLDYASQKYDSSQGRVL